MLSRNAVSSWSGIPRIDHSVCPLHAVQTHLYALHTWLVPLHLPQRTALEHRFRKHHLLVRYFATLQLPCANISVLRQGVPMDLECARSWFQKAPVAPYFQPIGLHPTLMSVFQWFSQLCPMTCPQCPMVHSISPMYDPQYRVLSARSCSPVCGVQEAAHDNTARTGH